MAKFKVTGENAKQNLGYRSYAYSLEIVRFVVSLPKEKVASILGNQLLRSGTSVGANIVEAQSGTSRKDFINFYSHALKSANESRFWLNLLSDAKIGYQLKITNLLDETDQIAKMLARSILTLRGK